jgi:DNA-binding transcriptional regulator YiaG
VDSKCEAKKFKINEMSFSVAIQRSNHNIFGEYMESLRQSMGLSLEGAAKILGVTKEILLQWERGIGLPPKELSSKISQMFRIRETEWLECLRCEAELRSEVKK